MMDYFVTTGAGQETEEGILIESNAPRERDSIYKKYFYGLLKEKCVNEN